MYYKQGIRLVSSLKKQKHSYTINKLKYIYDNNAIVIAVNCNNLSSIELNSIRLELLKCSENLNAFYIKNNLLRVLLVDSPLRLFSQFIDRSTLLLYTNDTTMNTQKLNSILSKNAEKLSLLSGKLTIQNKTTLFNKSSLSELLNYGFDKGLYYSIVSILQHPSFSVYQRISQYSKSLNS